jgi:hypothetical protein
VVTSRQWFDATLLIDDHDCGLVGVGGHQTRLAVVSNVGLLLVENHVLRHDLYQVICRHKSTVFFLDEATEDVGGVIFHLVAIPQLLSFAFNRADRVVATPEYPTLLTCTWLRDLRLH